MPASRVKRIAVMQRRAKVAAMTIEGLTQVEIAVRLGFEEGDKTAQVIVAQDMLANRKAWKQSTLQDFDAHKARILAGIYHCRAELYRAWHLSKRIKKSRIERMRAEKDEDGNALFMPLGLEIKKEKQLPSSHYAALILKTYDQEAELLGVTIKANGDLSSAPPMVGFVIMPPHSNGQPQLVNGETTDVPEDNNHEQGNGTVSQD